MSEDVPDSLKTTVIKPIIYGNVSRYLGKKREEDGRTHQWTAFLRPYNTNEDLSVFIRRVQFKLHDSYTNPIRVIHKPPFELTETGWGEFEITIKVFFTDQNEKPLVINHLIKLFHCNHEIMMGQKCLVREIYDEIVFVDPSPSFYRALVSQPSSCSSTCVSHETDFNELKRQTLSTLQDWNQKVTQGIQFYRKQLSVKKDVIEDVRASLVRLDYSSVSPNV